MAIDSAGRTPTTVQSASATSVTGTLPAGMQVGDFVVAQFSMSCTVAQFTPPSGWTELVAPAATNNVNRIVAVYGMFDPSSGPVGAMSVAANRVTVICQAYGGVDGSFPADVLPSIGVVAATPITIPQITTVTDGARLISGICVDSSNLTYTQPSGMTLLGTSTIGGGRGAGMADEVDVTAGATGTRQWLASAAGFSMRGYLMALRPASTGPAPTPVLDIAWVGAPTSGGFVVSAKTADATDVRVKVGTNAGVTTGVAWSTLATPDTANWRQHEITGLSPATPYWYAVEMTDGGGATHLSSVFGPVKTLPAVGAPASFRVAAGSCLLSGSTVTTAFDNLLAAAPDLVFHLGDFHYGNSSSTDQATHRAQLENQVNANTGLAAMLANIPTVYVKSDHDSGGGNGALPGTYTAPNRAAHLQVVPHLPQVVPEALYHSFVVGRIKIIMTDDRYQRTTTEYLDAAQVTWLQAELQTAEPVKVWMQNGPWHISDTPTDPTSGGDKWCDYPDQHAALAAWIEANAVGRILTVHGDSHSLELDDGSNAPGGVATFCTSPFVQSTMVRGGPYSEGTWPALTPGVGGDVASQYGLIDFTDTGQQITVTLSGRDDTDTERVSLQIVVATPQEAAREALTVVFADDDAADTTGVAAYADGNSFPNNGHRAVLLRNASSSPVTVTFDIPVEIDGNPVANKTVTVPGESEVMTGVWPPRIYNQPDGAVYIDYSAVTGVSVTVIEPRA